MRLVITVRAQKDMSPQGSTYPRKAVPIMRSHTSRDGGVCIPLVPTIWAAAPGEERVEASNDPA